MASFIDELQGEEQDFAAQLRAIILRHDKSVEEAPGAIMGAKNALCYNEQDIFKYGLALTKSGFTVHSMVMYANADVAATAKETLSGVKFQKGCFNIKDWQSFDLKAFDAFMRLSAKTDFSPVIEHYKRKK